MGDNGSNNRIAKRDYYELNAELKLTPEQLRSLTIDPCPRCEVRQIKAGVSLCNHCRQELAEQATRQKLTYFALAAFATWGLLMQLPAYKSAPTSDQFLTLGFIAVALVGFATFAWTSTREWLQLKADLDRTKRD